ncbi:MAG: ABC transporter substrate-binding protein [Acidimicrobiales bacterium]
MINRFNDHVRRKRAQEGGFTLIELLVVIIILGILAAVVVFAVGGVGDKGEASAKEIDERTLRTALEAYYAQNGEYPADQDDLVAAGLLSEPSTLSEVVVAEDQQSYQFVTFGGTLVVAGGATPPAATLNPAVTSEGGTHSNSEDMFNGLLRYERDGSIGGDLAQTFTFNNAVPAASNPNCAPSEPTAVCEATTTVATFVLRENVKFHNGDTLTPADVKFSFEKAILAAHGRTRAINLTLGVTGQNLTTVAPANAIQTLPATAGNGGTVIFNLRQVFAPLKFTLNVTEAPIISEAVYGPCFTAGTLFSGVACSANTNPVGTGPFKFESLDTTGIRTVKNPDYFRFDANGNRLPYFDVLFKRVTTGSIATALQSGTVDVGAVSNADRPLLAADSRIVLSQTPRGSGGGNCITTIAFNTTKRQPGTGLVGGAVPSADPASPYFGQNKPNSLDNARPHRTLGDARVREAIFKALNRNQFHTDIAFGAGRVADAPLHSIFQPDGAYQGPQPLPTFDIAAADALLDAAGWNGTRTTVGANTNIRTALNHPNETHSDPDLVVADGAVLQLEYLASTGNEAFGGLVDSQLAVVGIDVTPVYGNNASIVAPRTFHARTFDMTQISYCNNDEPQFGVRRQYHTDQLIQSNAFVQASGYKSLVMDQLWADASKAPDVASYQNAFLKIQRLALGLGTPANGSFPALTVTPGSPEDLQRIPMVQMLESAGTRGNLSICTGFNNNNTGLYMEGASCSR